MDKVQSMQEQMSNVSRDIGIPRVEKKKEMLRIKKHYNRNEECLW